jgi:hypothetical protein
MYEASNRVTLTIKGESLFGEVTAFDGRVNRRISFPDAARPDCDSCDKPDLLDSNLQVASVFQLVMGQQERNPMSGHFLGLRFEAVARAIEWGVEAGYVDDPDLVMRRIWILDHVYCRIQNAEVDRASKQKSG